MWLGREDLLHNMVTCGNILGSYAWHVLIYCSGNTYEYVVVCKRARLLISSRRGKPFEFCCSLLESSSLCSVCVCATSKAVLCCRALLDPYYCIIQRSQRQSFLGSVPRWWSDPPSETCSTPLGLVVSTREKLGTSFTQSEGRFEPVYYYSRSNLGCNQHCSSCEFYYVHAL